MNIYSLAYIHTHTCPSHALRRFHPPGTSIHIPRWKFAGWPISTLTIVQISQLSDFFS